MALCWIHLPCSHQDWWAHTCNLRARGLLSSLVETLFTIQHLCVPGVTWDLTAIICQVPDFMFTFISHLGRKWWWHTCLELEMQEEHKRLNLFHLSKKRWISILQINWSYRHHHGVNIQPVIYLQSRLQPMNVCKYLCQTQHFQHNLMEICTEALGALSALGIPHLHWSSLG